MPDLGDYITRLICDASKYAPGANIAIGVNKELSGSCNTIIGALNRQQKAIETSGRTTLDWINADQKASFEVKEHTRNLLEHVNALKAASAAKGAFHAGAKTATTLMVDADAGRHAQRQADYDRMFGDIDAREQEDLNWERRRAQGVKFDVLSGDPGEEQRQKRINSVRNMHARNLDRREQTGSLGFDESYVSRDEKQRFLREQQALEREMDANHILKPAEQDLLRGGLKKSQQEEVALRLESERTAVLNRLRGAMESAEHTEAEYTLEKMRGSKATEVEIKAAEQRANHMLLKPLRDRNASQAEIDEATAHINRTRNLNQNQQGRDNRKWAGVEGFRAIEDFFQGSAYGGLRGGILAASNNIGQMGAAFGAAGAMAGSAVSTVLILGSTAYEAWRKSSDGTNEAIAAMKEYDRMTSSVLTHLQQMREFKLESRGIGRQAGPEEGAKTIESLRDDIARRELELREKDKARQDQMRGMGLEGKGAIDVENEARRRADRTTPEWLFGGQWLPDLGMATGLMDRKNAGAAGLTKGQVNPENVGRLREQERDLLRGNEQLVEKKRLLMEAERENIRLQQNADKEAEVEIERGWQRSQQIFPDLTDEERKNKHRDFANAENAKFKDKFERGQSWIQSRGEDLLLSGFKNEKDRDYYAAQKEHAESMRRSEEAERLGILTPKERGEMDEQSFHKRHRDMRKTKYGDLQADGQSGFASADIKSTAGFNAVMKAMRYTEQSKELAELKRNGDITQEVATAVQNLAEVMKLAPVPVVDF